jgi:carboxylate-amine ligase
MGKYESNVKYDLEYRWNVQERKGEPSEQPIPFGQGIGIEIEYMIVSKINLKVLPIADKILEFFGNPSNNFKTLKLPPLIDISNEIVKHVIEFKGATPVRNLEEFARQMIYAVNKVNQFLEGFDAMLLPGSIHPYMNPYIETHIWAGKYKEIYNKFHELFDLRKHCWSNIQGVHLNLPYNSPQEYAILTAAVRIVLPLIPALTASSPICDGQIMPEIDYRLKCQMDSRKRLPLLMGSIIPEQIFSIEEYKTLVLKRIDAQIAEYDPNIILHPEWMNHRAAIPRFSRNCVEIKIIDVQENPILDIAICRFIELIVKGLMNNWWKVNRSLTCFTSTELLHLYNRAIVDAENAMFENIDYLEIFGIREPVIAKYLLRKIYSDICKHETIEESMDKGISMILERGTLGRQIRKVFEDSLSVMESSQSIDTELTGIKIFLELASCLQNGKTFMSM